MCQKTVIIYSCLGNAKVLVSAIWELKRSNSHREMRNEVFVQNDVRVGIETSYRKLHPERIAVSVERYKEQGLSLCTK